MINAILLQVPSYITASLVMLIAGGIIYWYTKTKSIKRLHKLVLNSYFGPFILTFFICLFILLMQFLWKYVDDLMGKDLEWYYIVELLFYASANLVPMALPLSILLSSIMTFGNLAEKSELVAMKSAGLSLFRIMAPLIVVIFMTSGAAFYFSNNLWPVANLKFRALLWDITEKKPTFNLNAGVFYNGIEGYSIRIRGKNAEDNTIQDVLIYEHKDPYAPNRKVIRAESGKMEKSEDDRFLILTLYNGINYEESSPVKKKGRKKKESGYFPHVTNKFGEHRIKFDLSSFQMEKTNEDLFQGNFEMLNLSQLQTAEDSLSLKMDERRTDFLTYLDKSYMIRRDTIPIDLDTVAPMTDWWEYVNLGERKTVLKLAANQARSNGNYVERSIDEMASREQFIDRHRLEWHRKFTLSFACVILFFIGAPLGAIIRKGGLGMPVVFSVVLFLIFHILSLTGEKMVKSIVVEPWFGMWMSSMILFPLGVFLTYKAAKDSKVFDRETWTKVFNTIFFFIPPIIRLLKKNTD